MPRAPRTPDSVVTAEVVNVPENTALPAAQEFDPTLLEGPQDREGVYSLAEDVRAIAVQVREDKGIFEHVSLERVLFLRKSGGSQKKIAWVRGIRGEISMLSDKVYILTVVSDNFDNLTPEGKSRVIEHELLHIPLEFDGKLLDHDIKDFRAMIEQYGVRYVHEAGSEPIIPQEF